MNDVTTYHVDIGRTGLNTNFPFAPSGGTWRRYVVLPTNAPVRAAPLYVGAFAFTAGPYAGQTHDIVIVASADTVVYAYAEDQLLGGSTGALWVQQSLGLASPRTGSNIPTPVGISSTPVIDRINATIYVIAYVHESSNDIYKIYALDLNTGNILDRATLNDPGAAGRPARRVHRRPVQLHRPCRDHERRLRHGGCRVRRSRPARPQHRRRAVAADGCIRRGRGHVPDRLIWPI